MFSCGSFLNDCFESFENVNNTRDPPGLIDATLALALFKQQAAVYA